MAERGKAVGASSLEETGDLCDRAQDERDQLRAERDALRLRLSRMRANLTLAEARIRPHLGYRKGLDVAHGLLVDVIEAEKADDALSGKGVG